MVAHSTIYRNRATGSGGGIYNHSTGTAEVTGSVTSGNLAATDPNISGTLASDTFNLVDFDLILNPLYDYGGPTLTHSLPLGSPAIDMGDPSFTAPPANDQRSGPFLRIHNGRIDIGAYEVQPLFTDVDGDHFVTGLDFLQLQTTPAVPIWYWDAEYGTTDLPLEAPSLLVNTASDVVNPYDQVTSLREAVNYANWKNGEDTITFDPSLTTVPVQVDAGEILISMI